MLTAEGISEVAYTTNPAVLGSWKLTIDDIMRMTTAADWDSWVTLKPAAAARLARTLNEAKPWKRNTRRALASGVTKVGATLVIEGEVVA